MKSLRVLLAVAFVVVALRPAAALTLARGGTTSFVIVVTSEATAAERTAARELAAYLERATSARFSVVADAAGAAAIRVGPSAAALRSGIDAAALGPEEWRILVADGELILTGGRPRGTLYAVYRFLEDHVGVRWWSPYVESVPRRHELVLPSLDEAGRPAFVYRDLHGLDGPREFQARNRINGHFSFLPGALGGNEGYGPPLHAHDFYRYVPPAEYFERHPEFFSEIDGERTHENAQLCLTNEALIEVVTDRLRGYIETARRDAAAAGEPAPRLFSFSQNDVDRACTCRPCRELRRREGSYAAPLVRFVNRVAERIEEQYPDVLLDTLAYRQTFDPPRDLAFRDNVALRLSALTSRDFLAPVRHEKHLAYRRAIDGWAARTRHLRIWDYAVTFGYRPNNLPLPNLRVIADDLRYYRDHGVEGLLIQHDHPVAADLRDLKVWVVMKLLEDPDRDVDTLVEAFTEGFYGAAAGTIRQYLAELDRAVQRRPTAIRYPTTYRDFRYLDPAFLRRSQELFDRAEREVADDPARIERVRHARFSLDRATLWRWEDRMARRGRPGPGATPIDRWAVLLRYTRTAVREIERRIPQARMDAKWDWLEAELRKLRKRLAREGGS